MRSVRSLLYEAEYHVRDTGILQRPEDKDVKDPEDGEGVMPTIEPKVPTEILVDKDKKEDEKKKEGEKK